MAGKVGGAAIPDGVMMVSGRHAGVAIVDFLGCVHAASFETVANPVKLPGLRAIASLGCSVMTTVKGIVKAEQLRIGAEGVDQKRYLAMAGLLLGSAAYSAGIAGLAAHLEKACAGEKNRPLAAAALNASETLSSALLIALLAATPAGKRIRGFHGAEHKTVHCADKGIAPIPENAYHQSRIHPRCGTSLSVTAEALYLASSTLVTPFLPAKYRPAASEALLLASLAAAYEGLMKNGGGALGKLGAWAQRLTTAEPDVQMLEAASAAIYAALEPDERA